MKGDWTGDLALEDGPQLQGTEGDVIRRALEEPRVLDNARGHRHAGHSVPRARAVVVQVQLVAPPKVDHDLAFHRDEHQPLLVAVGGRRRRRPWHPMRPRQQ
eukprot:3446513-Rhodomonas_salina.2